MMPDLCAFREDPVADVVVARYDVRLPILRVGLSQVTMCFVAVK